MQTDKHLFLIGFMGCGKSYYGQQLAERLHWPFIDLDDQLVQQSGKSISDLFNALGENGFRELEQKALQALSGQPMSIVATGGGTPCFFDNMDWMNAHGLTVYLKTSPALLTQRLRHERSFRPLLSGVQDADLQAFIENKLTEREPFYHRAQMILNQHQEGADFLQTLEKGVIGFLTGP